MPRNITDPITLSEKYPLCSRLGLNLSYSFYLGDYLIAEEVEKILTAVAGQESIELLKELSEVNDYELPYRCPPLIEKAGQIVKGLSDETKG